MTEAYELGKRFVLNGQYDQMRYECGPAGGIGDPEWLEAYAPFAVYGLSDTFEEDSQAQLDWLQGVGDAWSARAKKRAGKK